MSKQCPFAEGDLVDHRLFGFGTVNGSAVAVVRPSLRAPGGVEDAGWRVPVRWHDPERADGDMSSEALRRVSSPASRPFTFWERQWRPLHDAWLSARRELETAVTTFRPPPDAETLSRLRAAEDRAWSVMEAFVREDADGAHP